MGETIINLAFGTAKIFDGIIELKFTEGINFKTEDLQTVFELCDIYFPNKKFLLLSNRTNDFSVDLSPTLYKAFHKNLIASAAVCYNDASFRNAKFEKEFFKRIPFEVFRDYDEAVNWLKSYL
ncbi:MAG: hypothetical protein ACTIJ9_04025 [Aequorivita sp.]